MAGNHKVEPAFPIDIHKLRPVREQHRESTAFCCSFPAGFELRQPFGGNIIAAVSGIAAPELRIVYAGDTKLLSVYHKRGRFAFQHRGATAGNHGFDCAVPAGPVFMVAANIETGVLRAERFKQKPHRFLGKPIVHNVANKKHCIRRLLPESFCESANAENTNTVARTAAIRNIVFFLPFLCIIFSILSPVGGAASEQRKLFSAALVFIFPYIGEYHTGLM